MKVALFVPCYIDQFYPQVGIATLQLLEKLGVQAHFPAQQTCCGQPLANSGCERDALPIYKHFVETFSDYDYVVAPSGSCVYHVRKHFDKLDQTAEVQHVRGAAYDLIDFISTVLKVEEMPGSFPHKVGLHLSCHGQRGLQRECTRAAEAVAVPEADEGLDRDLEESVLAGKSPRVGGVELVAVHLDGHGDQARGGHARPSRIGSGGWPMGLAAATSTMASTMLRRLMMSAP